MNLLEKIEHIMELYLKRTTNSYILSKEEYIAFMKGISGSYITEIADAFNAGRQMKKGKYEFNNVNEFIKNKRIIKPN